MSANYLLSKRVNQPQGKHTSAAAVTYTITLVGDAKVTGSDHSRYEVRRGTSAGYVCGMIEHYHASNGALETFRAYGRSYGLQPMTCLGSFASLAKAVKTIESL